MNKARLFALLCAAMLLAVPFWGNPAAAQSQAEGGVTAFTDGLAYPNGEISRAITDLAVELDESRKFRLLPMMGSAGVANVRDLLRFRGADFAIVNNDVFALKEVFELYPEALEKLRYITKLRSQKVVLLARSDISAVDQLSGKKVLVFGPEAIAQRSASTIFDLLEVNAAIAPAPDAGRRHAGQNLPIVAQSPADHIDERALSRHRRHGLPRKLGGQAADRRGRRRDDPRYSQRSLSHATDHERG